MTFLVAQCLKKVILDSFSQLTKTLLRTYPDKSEEISKICEEISDSYISSSNSYVDKFHVSIYDLIRSKWNTNEGEISIHLKSNI